MGIDKSKIIHDIVLRLLNEDKTAAQLIINQEYPHAYYEIEKRTYNTAQKMMRKIG